VSSLGNKYQLGAKIGGGGMAEVYRGRLLGAEGFARPVAIKRIHASFSRDRRFGEMFVNEARIASLLQHANICSVLDFDRDSEGDYFLVMELVEGVDLHALVKTGTLPVSVALHVVGEVLKGLDHAHELVHKGKRLGIVHRDVSPHNVMLSWVGGVKLVDFGIAKAVAATNASQSGALKGKIAYMSPEQAQGERIDGRSDLFSVGVVLHELLTARRLFLGPSEPGTLARVLGQPIAPPREINPLVPPDVEAVAMKLLSRERDHRYGTAHEALDALLDCRSMSARGSLDLRDLMSERFPKNAGLARQDDSPTAVADLRG
jgi:serine/threonine-protein kinase